MLFPMDNKLRIIKRKAKTNPLLTARWWWRLIMLVSGMFSIAGRY